jgi:putative transposase
LTCCVGAWVSVGMRPMPRHPRVAQPGFAYHVLNRAVGRARLFRRDKDYAAFQSTLFEARRRLPTPLLAWCVMPNHWHFVLWPRRGRSPAGGLAIWGRQRPACEARCARRALALVELAEAVPCGAWRGPRRRARCPAEEPGLLCERPETEAELDRLRRSVVRGAPFRDVEWQRRVAEQLGLQSTLKPRGPPRIRPKVEPKEDFPPFDAPRTGPGRA